MFVWSLAEELRALFPDTNSEAATVTAVPDFVPPVI